jgi:hypothetical protein
VNWNVRVNRHGTATPACVKHGRWPCVECIKARVAELCGAERRDKAQSSASVDGQQRGDANEQV